MTPKSSPNETVASLSYSYIFDTISSLPKVYDSHWGTGVCMKTNLINVLRHDLFSFFFISCY